MYNDSFEQIRKMQELISKSFLPLQRFQSQFEMINKNLLPMFDQVNSVQHSLKPMFESILKQQEIMNSALSSVISESAKEQLSKIQAAFNEMKHFSKPNFNIPQIIYPELERLLDVVDDVFPKEDNSDLQSSLTISSPIPVEVEKNTLTWVQLLTILVMIFQALYPVYSDSQTSLQRERIHDEQLEQAERHHIEEMKQKDRHTQEELAQDDRQHQESMDAFTQFISFITPLIPSGEEPEDEDRQDQ